MKTWAIILAAGRGSRLASATNGIAKQFLEWRNRPLYWHSALVFSRSICVDGIIFVLPEYALQEEREKIALLSQRDNLGLPWKVVPGGERRQDSCLKGMEALPGDCEGILIHDAARCFVSARLARNVQTVLSESQPAVIPVIPFADTVKLVDDNGMVAKTLPRDRLRAAQTPQGFYLPALKRAFASYGSGSVTDEASLVEALGLPVLTIPGDSGNRKITTPDDLELLTEKKGMPCSGLGYDVHRFGPGRPLRLGGIAIESEFQVIAHSDGDVLLHALIDALFACASLGDIGRHFPDTDPLFDGISSAVLLDRCLQMVYDAGVRICHVDLTVIAQKPKLSRWAEEIRRNVARLLAIDKNCVNFKATTEEGLGFTGAQEGLKALALVTAERLPCQTRMPN